MRCPYNPRVICAYSEIDDTKFNCLTCHRRWKMIHHTPATPIVDKVIKTIKLMLL